MSFVVLSNIDHCNVVVTASDEDEEETSPRMKKQVQALRYLLEKNGFFVEVGEWGEAPTGHVFSPMISKGNGVTLNKI